MKTIKIFIASSEELEDDRNAFGNLVRKLNKTYEKRGIHLELFEWEDYDAAYNNRRKQDEYNDEVRASDMFLAVFHTKAGKFTIEEFDVATEEFRKKGAPKSYVYCKDLRDGEIESEELKEFKRRLFDEMGHYWSRYANRDTMQLHFVMQLQMVENSRGEDLKVKDGNVVLHDQPIARMENLPFAGLNEDFQKMSARLAELPSKIEKARAKTEKYPDDEDFKDDLQTLLNEYNKLRDDFAEYQNNLFATAQRMAKLQGERISERMRRAMDAFNNGKIHEANIILDEAERDGERALNDYKQSKEITEQKRQNVIKSIEEITLKALTLMADLSIPVEERIVKVEQLYEQADTMAQDIEYDADSHDDILDCYSIFLSTYGLYDKALAIYKRIIDTRIRIYGEDNIVTAVAYNDIGLTYTKIGDHKNGAIHLYKALSILNNHTDSEAYSQLIGIIYNNIGFSHTALGEFNKAIDCFLKTLSFYDNTPDNPRLVAMAYCNLGNAFIKLDKFAEGIEYCHKAINHQIKFCGEEEIDLAASYINLGGAHHYSGEFGKALEFYHKALEVQFKILGKEHPEVASTYNHIGMAHSVLGEFDKAIEYLGKALAIEKRSFGENNIKSSLTYINLGNAYQQQGDFDTAISYYTKALDIRINDLGEEHPDTATTYHSLAYIYLEKGDYYNAIKYATKAIDIQQKIYDSRHHLIAGAYNTLGVAYGRLGEFDKATYYLEQAIDIQKEAYSEPNPDLASSYCNIGDVLRMVGDYERAIELTSKGLDISINIFGEEHSMVASCCNNIGLAYYMLQRFDQALTYFNRALSIQSKILEAGHYHLAMTYNNIGIVYNGIGEYNKANEVLTKALEIATTALDENTPNTAAIYLNLGISHQGLNELDKALSFLKRSLKIRQQVLGKGHTDCGMASIQVGAILHQMGEFEEATDYAMIALDIFEKTLGEEHPYTTECNAYLQLFEKSRIDSLPGGRRFVTKVARFFGIVSGLISHILSYPFRMIIKVIKSTKSAPEN